MVMMSQDSPKTKESCQKLPEELSSLGAMNFTATVPASDEPHRTLPEMLKKLADNTGLQARNGQKKVNGKSQVSKVAKKHVRSRQCN